MQRIAVIDFETTGISPETGGRATEIAIALVEQGRVVDRFQSLMNAGAWIPPFITQLTGIDNAMIQAAPTSAVVMTDAARFVGDVPMVAHNAAFDRKFWQHELRQLGLPAPQAFACTVLLSRRLYPQAPNHKLAVMADFLGLPPTGRAHRALADAEMAAALLGRIQQDLRELHGLADPDHALLMRLQACSRASVARWLRERAAGPETIKPLPVAGRAEPTSSLP